MAGFSSPDFVLAKNGRRTATRVFPFGLQQGIFHGTHRLDEQAFDP
jgi:hypothetical protein